MSSEPTRKRKLKHYGVLLWSIGLATAILLIVQQGIEDVAAATAAAGWGILWIVLIQFLPMTADTTAWSHLLRPYGSTPWMKLFWARWIAESVNNLLPTARVGGEFVRAWLAYRKMGIAGPVAGASVTVDLTAIAATQLVFTLIGIVLLVLRGANEYLLQAAAIGTGILLAMLLAFLFAQHSGVVALLERAVRAIASRNGWPGVAGDAQSLEIEIKAIYSRRSQLFGCAFWHLVGWAAGTLEVWIALSFLGHPVTFLDALMLESLIQAVHAAAFFIPGALGVQEGGLILLGAVIGIPPDVSLALSLVKRIREVVLGVPALLIWQLVEGRRFARAIGRRHEGST